MLQTICTVCYNVVDVDMDHIRTHDDYHGVECRHSGYQSDWEFPKGVTVERISLWHWTVGRDGEELADVYGDGPTSSTRAKTVYARNAHMNPDAAPGGYSRNVRDAIRRVADR